MRKSNIYIIIAILCFSCSSHREIGKCDKDFIIREFYNNDCFSKEQTYKDSLYNLEQLVKGYRTFFDSVNNLNITYHIGTLDYCNTTRFLTIYTEDLCTFIPFCDERLSVKIGDTSLVNKNTRFSQSIDFFILKNQIKDPHYFIRSIFDSLFFAEKIDLQTVTFKNSIDSLRAINVINSDNNNLNYHTIGVGNGIWSISFNNNSTNIVLVNSKLISCFNH